MRISDWSSDVCSSDLNGVSGCGTPTLPPPVLPGSGSTGRGLFRSQPAFARQAPRGWGDHSRARREGEGGSAGPPREPDADHHQGDARGAADVDREARGAEQAEMVDRRRAGDLADEDEEDRVADPEARRDEGYRDDVEGDEGAAEIKEIGRAHV